MSLERSIAPSENVSSPYSGKKVKRQKFKCERQTLYSRNVAGANCSKKYISARISSPMLVTNIPYNVTWKNLKDLFKRKVGEVKFVKLYLDYQGRSRGYGVYT